MRRGEQEPRKSEKYLRCVHDGEEERNTLCSRAENSTIVDAQQKAPSELNNRHGEAIAKIMAETCVLCLMYFLIITFFLFSFSVSPLRSGVWLGLPCYVALR